MEHYHEIPSELNYVSFSYFMRIREHGLIILEIIIHTAETQAIVKLWHVHSIQDTFVEIL